MSISTTIAGLAGSSDRVTWVWVWVWVDPRTARSVYVEYAMRVLYNLARE
jgi:hypothetical protein